MAALDSLEVVGPERYSVRAEADSHVHLPNNRCGSPKRLGADGLVKLCGSGRRCRILQARAIGFRIYAPLMRSGHLVHIMRG